MVVKKAMENISKIGISWWMGSKSKSVNICYRTGVKSKNEL